MKMALRPTVQCKQCGVAFENPRPGKKRVFCSTDCRLQYMREHVHGTPFVKGQKAWNKGLTKEQDERVQKYAAGISETRKGKFTGADNPFYGRHHSNETKELIGSYHYLGKKNVVKGYYGRGFNAPLKLQIKTRDGFVCKECGVTPHEGTLAVHHIDYDTTNHDPSNLITLCNRCNSKANYNRADWVEHFRSVMENILTLS